VAQERLDQKHQSYQSLKLGSAAQEALEVLCQKKSLAGVLERGVMGLGETLLAGHIHLVQTAQAALGRLMSC
jgi:hypothetical protein